MSWLINLHLIRLHICFVFSTPRSDAVHSLLDGINDKDETVRRAIEAALGRTVEKRPNEALMALCDYRIARPKMPESQVALLMRYMPPAIGS